MATGQCPGAFVSGLHKFRIFSQLPELFHNFQSIPESAKKMTSCMCMCVEQELSEICPFGFVIFGQRSVWVERERVNFLLNFLRRCGISQGEGCSGALRILQLEFAETW
jgi:hypothetical protein